MLFHSKNKHIGNFRLLKERKLQVKTSIMPVKPERKMKNRHLYYFFRYSV